MQITFLGGAAEIGASSLLLEVADRRLLIDAGLRPKSSGPEALPALDTLNRSPDAILLTHAHIDHLGAIPVVHQRFPNTPVITSEPTAALAKIMLLDSVHLQQILPGQALYNRDDVQHTLDQLRPVLMNRWYHLAPGLSLCLVPAGHLLGAVSILLDTAEGRIVISGDVSLTHQRAVPGFAAPPFKADVLVLESTYGDGLHPGRQEEERRLVENVTEVVLGGGIALVPSFALGRAQEVMLTLRQAQEAREIPYYPIHADGLVRAVTDVYNRQRPYLTPALRLEGDHVIWKSGQIARVRAARRQRVLEKPGCIVASSGMLIGGPSVFYAQNLIEDPANAIFITGYTDEESPGRRLQDLRPGGTLTLEGETVRVGCQVRKFNLSGHGDAAQLGMVADHFEPRLILLVHGEQSGRQGLRERLAERYAVQLPKNGETVSLAPPRWTTARPPYLLDVPEARLIKSDAAEEATTLIGQTAAAIPLLGVRERVVTGGIAREDVRSGFPCLSCGTEKRLTVDLGRRLIDWRCPGCGHRYQTRLLNLKQKDVSKMSDEEQERLIELITVSVALHEPLLSRDWADLLAEPGGWRPWLDRLDEVTVDQPPVEPRAAALLPPTDRPGPRLAFGRRIGVDGPPVIEDIPSGFPCLFSETEKRLTIDLGRRSITWRCPDGDNRYTENIFNLKQKDVVRLSEVEQAVLLGLVFVSLSLHEPILDKTWSALLADPESWNEWLIRLKGGP